MARSHYPYEITSFLVTDLAGCSQLVPRASFRSRLPTRDPRRPSAKQRRWRPPKPFRQTRRKISNHLRTMMTLSRTPRKSLGAQLPGRTSKKRSKKVNFQSVMKFHPILVSKRSFKIPMPCSSPPTRHSSSSPKKTRPLSLETLQTSISFRRRK